MPYVTIKILKEAAKAKPEYKTKLIARVSDAVADVTVEVFGSDREKLLDHLWCVIEEVPMANWGVHGASLTPERLKS